MAQFINEKKETMYFSSKDVGKKRVLVVDGVKWTRVPRPQPLSRFQRLTNAISALESTKNEYEDALNQLEEYEEVNKPITKEQRDEIQAMFEGLSSVDVGEIEELRDEIDNWKSGMEGTNLENTSKYSELEECYDTLENGISSLEGVDLDSLVGEDETIDDLKERLQSVIDELDNAISELENTEFPRMF